MINSDDIFHGKVLIVDDQEVNILLLERLLRGAGYVCITSTMDPCRVCELYLKNRYDLILLDLQMPGVAGRIQITDSTQQLLGEPFVLENRGVIGMKGKGKMHTWFLNSRKG